MVSLIADASVHYIDNNISLVDNTGLTEKTENYTLTPAVMKMYQYCSLSLSPPDELEMACAFVFIHSILIIT